jgi:hypothetical protein
VITCFVQATSAALWEGVLLPKKNKLQQVYIKAYVRAKKSEFFVFFSFSKKYQAKLKQDQYLSCNPPKKGRGMAVEKGYPLQFYGAILRGFFTRKIFWP